MIGGGHRWKPFPTVFPAFAAETVKTVSEDLECVFTGLKPGANETSFEPKLVMLLIKLIKKDSGCDTKVLPESLLSDLPDNRVYDIVVEIDCLVDDGKQRQRSDESHRG